VGREDEVLKVERRKIAELKNDPANARKHSPRNLKAIRDSLDVFEQQKPIVVDSRGVVIAGNGTLQAARELGWEEIAVVVTDLDPAHAQAFGIADNRTAELAEWDTDVLGQLLEGMDSDLADILSIDDLDLNLPDIETATEDDQGVSESLDFSFRIEITVSTEQEQEELYNRLQAEGLECRLLTL
jgi:ParB-like chromosome segregation protein Spo0J